MRIFKDGVHKGEAYLWNLHVRGECRRLGFGRTLLLRAISVARSRGCEMATLDWDIKESPRWVFDWYTRNGFEEREFGRDCAFMVKTLKDESK
jgi:ribosomal protein S18 acetylase RimI-like enzyme